MSYEIFSISGAPRPWRVTLGLVIKGIDFTLHTLQGSTKEHKRPEFLALNPRGRVPVLRDGDFVLTESLAILSYLERAHPEPPLFGTSAREHARIWELASVGVHDFYDASAALVRPLFFAGKDATDEGVKSAAAAFRPELARLDAVAGGQRFLGADRPTAADCVYFPSVRVILRAAERFPETMARLELHPFADAFPRLATWVADVEAIPGYEKTFPQHWRA